MKKFVLIYPLFFCWFNSFAQPIPRQSIEDDVLGWVKVYNFKGAKAPLKVDNKIYTVSQLSICDSIANWMQASYLPKGGLGDVKRAVLDKIGLYNKNNAGMPQSYGAYANTYSELKYNAEDKIALLTTDAINWSIMANGMVGIPANVICSPSKYYFTLPSFKEHGYPDDDPQIVNMAIHKNTKKYPAYVRRNSNGLLDKVLLLYPEERFPFIKITKGEYLEQLAVEIERKYISEKEEAFTKWYTDASRASARKYADDRYLKRITVLKDNRDKYKNDLNTVAEIFTSEPDLLLENYSDVFTGNGGSDLKLPVYKIDPLVAEQCKNNQPQWLTIMWNGSYSNPVGKHQQQSIMNNFNFDYVYNFFFNPEKVKGQFYKPLHSP